MAIAALQAAARSRHSDVNTVRGSEGASFGSGRPSNTGTGRGSDGTGTTGTGSNATGFTGNSGGSGAASGTSLV